MLRRETPLFAVYSSHSQLRVTHTHTHTESECVCVASVSRERLQSHVRTRFLLRLNPHPFLLLTGTVRKNQGWAVNRNLI